MKMVWVSLGVGAGLALGTRANRDRFDRFASWSKEAALEIGLTAASGRVVDAAKSARADLRHVAASRSQAVLGRVADSAVERIGVASEAFRSVAVVPPLRLSRPPAPRSPLEDKRKLA